MTHAVQLTDVTRIFPGRLGGSRARRRVGDGAITALSRVTLTIPERSRFGIVGESGSGKSTMMRLIAALDAPTSGRITVFGAEVTGRRERQLRFLRRTLQMVFQDPMGSLNPRMRVGEIVAEPLRAQRRSGVERAVHRALEEVGLDVSAARRFPHQFSGGQRQRISIARAIAPRPKILIADEAVSALDVTVRSQVLQVLREIAERGELTLIFVSHDLSVVRHLCDHVAVLQAGRLVETGPTDRVYDDPRDAYTRDLLAAVPTLAQSLAAARRREIDRKAVEGR